MALNNERKNVPDLLVDLHDIASTILRDRCEINATDATAIAWELVDEFRQLTGGQMCYIPKGDQMDLAERDRTMWREFNGSNHTELARKYGLTKKAVYQRLRLIQASIKTGKDEFFLED